MTAKTTEIKPDSNGRYHSPYSSYSTALINKMQAHLRKKKGETWGKVGSVLVKKQDAPPVKALVAKEK